MSEYFSEIFRIVEGGLRGDVAKVRAYAGLLADKAEAVGHKSTADRLRKMLTDGPGVQIRALSGMGKRDANEQRFRFVSDDDGHDYLIPADKKEQFDRWIEHQGRLWEPGLSDKEFKQREAEYSGEDFNDYATGTSPNCYTFTDPQEGK